MRSVETVTSIGRRLRYAQIGGGRDSFIGAIHRRAAALDGFLELTAGALSSTGDKALASARDLLLPPERSYASWQELVECERARPAEERIDFVSIVTPNHVHFDPALACVEAGFHVVIDKPMVHDSIQAERLSRAVAERGTVFAVTYNYTGYPMVKEARHRIAQGRIGAIRRVVVEYAQGWLSQPIDAEGHKQAEWRTDPARAGIAGALGDIGTHCESLVSYVTGLEIRELSADLATFVPGRRLDDDVSVLLRFAPGDASSAGEDPRGVLWVSQVAAGAKNRLTLRVYGTAGGLLWDQEDPDRLLFLDPGGDTTVARAGDPGLCAAAERATHLFPGAAEGFLGAFANIYANAADTMRARLAGREPTELELDFPGVADGARGVRFMERVVKNAAGTAKWSPF